MSKIKAIRTQTDYAAALARVDALMDAKPGTPEGEEFDVLTDLVEHYEEKQEPMDFPSIIPAIRFRMEQAALAPRDLVPFLGSRAKVSEILSGKRSLTMPMARALHDHLGIPAEILFRNPWSETGSPLTGLEWHRFPLKIMAKRRWIPRARNLEARAQEVVQNLIQRAGGPAVAGVALFRKNDFARANAKADPYSLKAWCWKLLGDANETRPSVRYKAGTVTLDFLRQLARLSSSQDGPRLAREYLAKHGIQLVVVPHLPKTYLDGAALKRADGTPVIGLTLRYDRIDNFWFCLLHELAHVGRHMESGATSAFVDDLTLREVEHKRQDPKELEADEWAEEALVPSKVWEGSIVRKQPTPMSIINLANTLRIHPAIVAGRIRHERRNYRLLSQFVGTGEVRRQFGVP